VAEIVRQRQVDKPGNNDVIFADDDLSRSFTQLYSGFVD